MGQANASNVVKINDNISSNSPNDSREHRKKRTRNEIRDEVAAKSFGLFLRYLRKRVDLTCESLADRLEYQRPTQIIRREAGLMNVPLAEVEVVCDELKCDKTLFVVLRIAAFEELTYNLIGDVLCKKIGYAEYVPSEELIKAEVDALEEEYITGEKTNLSDTWLGARCKS